MRFEPLEERRLLTITAQQLVGYPPDASQFIDCNGTTFFRGDDVQHGSGLWKTDGTAAGTVFIKNVVADQLIAVSDTLFFTAPDPANGGTELWKSDGTAAGTVIVKDINPYFNSFFGPKHLTNVNGTLFFDAFDIAHGRELWKSDGTESGTVMVTDLFPGTYDDDNLVVVGNNGISFDQSRNLVNFNGTLFFSGESTSSTTGDTGYELFKSDGTAAGTVLVKDIRPNNVSPLLSSFPDFLTVINGTLFFAANDGVHGDELWKTDGTTAGTALVKDISPGAGSSYPFHLINVNGTLFFTANDGVHGSELWKSDGTAAGTVLVKDIQTGTATSSPYSLTNANGTLFFAQMTVYTVMNCGRATARRLVLCS